METLLTKSEAARRLGLSRERVRVLAGKNDIRTVEPIPGVVRITATELARFRRLSRPTGVAKARRK